MMKAVSILGVAVALATTGATAEPQFVAPEHVRAVPFQDLNLQTPAGVAQLEARIVRAARSICATPHLASSIWLDQARDSCLADTIAATRASVEAAVRQQRARALQTAAAQ